MTDQDKTRSVGSLRPDPRNARRHTERNVRLIAQAMQDVGTGRSIVIDEDDQILAGHGTVEAAKAAGITKLQVVEVDGDAIVAIRRSNLTPEQKAMLALYDNRASELSEWDSESLAALTSELDLSSLFTEPELASLAGLPLAGILQDERAGRTDEWRGMPEFSAEDISPCKQVTVSFRTAEDVERFSRLIGQPVSMTTRSVWFPAFVRHDFTQYAYQGKEGANAAEVAAVHSEQGEVGEAEDGPSAGEDRHTI